MWCIECQQDVPALPAGDKQGLCCARCGQAVRVDRADAGISRPAYDSWELGEELRQIERLLQIDPTSRVKPEPPPRCESARLDLSHNGPTAWHIPSSSPIPAIVAEPIPPIQHKTPAGDRNSVLSAFTWSALSVGTAGFVCGGILMGWSLVTHRQELWVIGLPAALVGQIALLIGLTLQLDRLWRANRKAAAKLDTVDEQLNQLKASTTLAGVTSSSTAGVFYSHLASGASPQLLLTDLKSQIDLLALKIASQK